MVSHFAKSFDLSLGIGNTSKEKSNNEFIFEMPDYEIPMSCVGK